MSTRLLPLVAVMLAFASVRSLAATTHFVDANGTNPVSPYTSWATAATNIQDAVSSSGTPGDMVLVTNGVYKYGGWSLQGSNRLFIGKNITVQSVNGPTFTMIQGYQVPGTTNGDNAVRCVYIQSGILSGFTLTNGATQNFETGGGVYCQSKDCLVTNCVIAVNAAYSGGGGAFSGTLVNCSLVGNYGGPPSIGTGGGASQSTLINCLVAHNYSGYVGGGVFNCISINCTVVGNSSSAGIGGVDGGIQKNCIIYYNSPDNVSSENLTNCCTIPDFGVNDITNAPQFANLAAGDFHLNAASPCINAGNNSFITNSTDFDGNPRIIAGTVDIGAYEFQSPIHYVSVSNTAPVSPFTNWMTAATNIQDAVNASSDGDLVLVTNGFYASGGQDVFGSNRVAVTRAITVQSVNGPAATVITGVTNSPNVRCVFLTNGAALVGFTLTNGSSGGSAGGVLSSGFNNSTISNCLIIGNVSLDGGGGVSGVFYNCTITGNNANSGGAVFSAIMYNCLVSSNSAGNGGGCYSGTAYNCRFIGNTAGNGGGGYNSFFQNCLFTGNTATGSFGGGAAYQSSLENCTVVMNRYSGFKGGAVGGALNCGAIISSIVYNNTSLSLAGSPNYSGGGWVENSCTTPLPPNGSGNFATDPMLVNQAGGDFHLQSNSPCINAGNNTYASSATDLDGNSRIVAGTVDVGAYEYQTPVSAISYAWLQQFGLPINAGTDTSDADGDGMNNWQEWIAGTVPTDNSSVLKMLTVVSTNNPDGVIVSWQTVNNRTYFLQLATSLAGQPAFSSIQSNLTGQAGTTSYTDTNATGNGPFFYRVGAAR